MKKRQYRIFCGDFETTVYDGQDHTEVWASALVELNTENVEIHSSIRETFSKLKKMKENVIIYYHNLKFDGAFWLSYLLVDLGLKQAVNQLSDNPLDIEWQKEKEMRNNSFKYSISDKGQWYTITIKVNDKFIEIRDSLKLLPFSVKRMGDAFKTKHRKLEMEYKGFRYAGCEITEKEREYIANDVLVVKECLELMFSEGHDKLTIGSCCMSEYKNIMSTDFDMFFPPLTDITPPEYIHDKNVDEYIRRSYRGGWCYLVKGAENKVFENGLTADVNSLYPSVMHSESGNYYPVGNPNFWQGNYIHENALKPNRYFFVRIRTRFYIKEGKLPFIQIKGSFLYKGTEMLETSDIKNPLTGEYSRYYKDKNGNVKDSYVELTLTMTDYYLLLDHYELVDFEILSGCWFYSEIGLFDEYINKYREIKVNSKGAKREQAKLFLNNLYGKMASSTDSSFKFAYVKDNGVIGFYSIEAHDKKAGFIAVGSAITSYARNFTIRTAQKNFHGADKAGFKYADTDSIHCDLQPEQLVDVPTHKTAFNHWSLESYWDKAIFARQKTYIEHVTHTDGEPVESPYYDIKCAGMPKRCKDLFDLSMNGITKEELEHYNVDEQEFLREKRTLEDFRIGLNVPSKLMPKRIRGGILLVETTYKMH